ncbi:hypothetical protein CP8484711_0487B, partial [Chlamydia psittaci 84-8471/1]
KEGSNCEQGIKHFNLIKARVFLSTYIALDFLYLSFFFFLREFGHHIRAYVRENGQHSEKFLRIGGLNPQHGLVKNVLLL